MNAEKILEEVKTYLKNTQKVAGPMMQGWNLDSALAHGRNSVATGALNLIATLEGNKE